MSSAPLSRLDQSTASDDELRSLAKGRAAAGTEPWRVLTSLPQKWDSYRLEAEFGESLHDAGVALGRDNDHVLQAHCQVSIKPDGLASRTAVPLVEFMKRNGFLPVAWRAHKLRPLEAREIWRYQWNVATLDRLRLFDLVIAQAPTLNIWFRDTLDADVPATVRLRGLKGSAVPELRKPNTLRAVCSAPNRLLTLLHAPDEPIDLVRELGIVASTPERYALLTELSKPSLVDRSASVLDAAKRLEKELPHLIGSEQAADLAMRQMLENADPEVLSEYLSISEDGVSFYNWFNKHRSFVSSLDPWVLISDVSFRVGHDKPGEVCTIDDDGRPEWFAGNGRRVRWTQK